MRVFFYRSNDPRDRFVASPIPPDATTYCVGSDTVLRARTKRSGYSTRLVIMYHLQ